jgi:hypothetical protein
MRILRHGPAPLYHGSARLYSLQCYIRRSKPLLQRYLFDLGGRLPVRVSPNYQEWLDEVRDILGRGDLLFPGGGNPYLPWTVDILFLRILEEMYASLGYTLRLSTLMPALFPSANWPVIPKLLAWLRTVEGYASVEALEAEHSLEPEFFSVMRQPVQFFGSQETALLYGKGENQLYQYQPVRYLRLLDISDVTTVRELVEPGQPFASFAPHSASLVQYYTERGLADYRASALTHHLLEFYSRDAARQQRLNRESGQRTEALLSSYSWVRFRRVVRAEEWRHSSKAKRWASLLTGQSYRDMLTEELLVIKSIQPAAYQLLLTQWQVSGVVELRSAILKVYPEESVADRPVLLLDVFEGYLSVQLEAEGLRTRREIGSWLVSAVSAGGNFLGAQPGVDFLSLWVELGNSFWGGVRTFIYGEFGLKYFSYFTTEIASPAGDWHLSQWETLHTTSRAPRRFSTYLQDTMIVLTLTTSDLFQQRELDGWWCTEPGEIMLYQPAAKGQLTKVTSTYHVDRCRYTGDETEENFLDEFA